MEDATGKHPVTPGEMIPARELLGDMYTEVGDTKNAIAAYKLDLEKHSNRFNGLYGLAKATAKSGDMKQAKEYYSTLLSVADGTSDRKEFGEAKKLVR